MRNKLSLHLAAILFVAATANAQTFENIGDFTPTDISADGSVVVGTQNNQRAFRWENNTLTELGSENGVISSGAVAQIGHLILDTLDGLVSLVSL